MSFLGKHEFFSLMKKQMIRFIRNTAAPLKVWPTSLADEDQIVRNN